MKHSEVRRGLPGKIENRGEEKFEGGLEKKPVGGVDRRFSRESGKRELGVRRAFV